MNKIHFFAQGASQGVLCGIVAKASFSVADAYHSNAFWFHDFANIHVVTSRFFLL